jgi:hypothetical protein
MNDLELLQTKMRQEPFWPFIIEFQSGHRIPIGADSEILFPRKRPELVIALPTTASCMSLRLERSPA